MATLYQNGLLFDGHQPNLLADQYLLVEGKRIAHIGKDKPQQPVERVVDLRGRTLMPGLIDAHFHAYAAHVDFPYLESLPVTFVAQKGRHLMENALKRGFTTVRDAGGADHGLWLAIEQGLVKGPRLFFSGRALSQTGGHGDVRKPHMEPCACAAMGNLAEIVDGVDEVRKAVREALRRGAHQIKLFVSGGIISPSDPIWMLQFSNEEILAAVDEATRRRTYVMAHAYTGETIERAIRCGVRSIEHANLITAQAAKAVAAANAFVVPTLATYDALTKFGHEAGVPKVTLDKLEEVKSKGLEAVQLCRDGGVKLGFGTDLLGELHTHQLDELRLRSEVDSPFEVLHSATAINAALLQRPDELGCLREGAYADMLIVDGNPLEDLDVLREDATSPPVVLKDGEIVAGEFPQ